MSDLTKTCSIRSKIWIEDESGGVVFGMGRVKILQAIHRNGSIHAAAKELGMSYRGVWGRIKATEERLGRPLLVRNIGGVAGGGSRLTPFAEELIRQFSDLHRSVVLESDRLFETAFEPRPVREAAKLDLGEERSAAEGGFSGEVKRRPES
jgi:molybdate transport system regulatory protein